VTVPLLFANNASSRLYATIDAVTTSIRVEAGDGAKFPQPDGTAYFLVTVEDRRSSQIEIMLCIGRTGDILNVVRAQEGTAAQAFEMGATVSNRMTAGTMAQLAAAAGVNEAPVDGYQYGRQDEAWTKVTWTTVTEKPATYPPTLPIPSSGVVGLDAKQAAQDAEIATKLDAADYTAEDVLAKIIQIDGPGSGLDADTLDGHDSSYFATEADMTAVEGAITNLDGRIDVIEADTTDWSEIQNKPVTFPPTLPIPSSGVTGLDAKQSEQDDRLTAVEVKNTAQDAAIATKLSDAPNDTNAYGRKAAAWVDVAEDVASSEFRLMVRRAGTWLDVHAFFDPLHVRQWLYQLTVSPPPSSTQVRPNNAVQSAVTALYFHKTDLANQDATMMLTGLVKAGMQISLMTHGDPTRWAMFKVTGAPVFTDPYFTVPVSFVAESGVALSSGVRTIVTFYGAGGGASVIISDTPPVDPAKGTLWYESDTGNTFIFYEDADSSQWVQQNIQPQNGEVAVPEYIASSSADLSFGFKIAGNPAGSVNRFVWNDKPDLSGKDVLILDEAGQLSITTPNVGWNVINDGAGGYKTIEAGWGGWLQFNKANSNFTFYKTATTLAAGAVATPTYQFGVATDGVFTNQGAIVAAGSLFTTNGYVNGATGHLIMGPSASGGSIYLRPNGVGTATGELNISPAGLVGIYGGLSCSGGITAVTGGITCNAHIESLNGSLISQAAAGGNAHVIFQNSAGAVGGYCYLAPAIGAVTLSAGSGTAQIQGNGNFVISGAVGQKSSGTAWSNPSDERIKEVVGDYETGLAEILQLQPKRFTYKGNDTPNVPGADPSSPEFDPEAPVGKEFETAPYPDSPHYQMATDGTEVAGFVAQEVEQVMPAMVTQGPGWIDGQEVQDFRTLDQSNLILALVNAVKELSAKVNALEAAR